MSTITLKNFIDHENLVKDLSYSDLDLTAAMMNQAGLFARYGVLAAQASAQVDLVKLKLEKAEADVYKAKRDEAAASGEKITEAMLGNMVALDEDIIDLKLKLSKAKRVEAIAKIAVEGFRHRRDMLVQQGLISREERKGDIRIMEKKTREDILSAAKDREVQRMKNKMQNADNQID